MARLIEILLVEDSPSDVRIAREAFLEGKLTSKLKAVSSVEEALECLQTSVNGGAIRPPDLILLDLNLGKSSGFDLLKELKGNKKTKMIPAVVLTSSRLEEDIRRCYELGANSVTLKPIDLYSFLHTLQLLEEYWVEMSVLPGQILQSIDAIESNLQLQVEAPQIPS